MKIKAPETIKQLRSFIGMINYYRDFWIRRSHVLTPLTKLTSSKQKWSWGDEQMKAFSSIKKIVAREVLLTYPDFNKAHEKAFKKEGKVNGNERIETEGPMSINVFQEKDKTKN